jgi:hypothetical protein
MRKIKLYGTTDASGDATITDSGNVHGLLHSVEWIDGDLADGVGAVLSYTSSDEAVARTLLTLTAANDDAVYYPRELEDDNAGAALTGVYTMPIVNGALKLVISSGGNAKTGGCVVHIVD